MILALDTNFLVYCAKQKIDFLSEIDRLCNFKYSIIVPEQVASELKKLSKGSNAKDRKAVVVALQILKKYRKEGKVAFKKIEASDADSALLKFDNKNSAIATLDSELKKKIKKASVLTIRHFNHLDFD